MCHHQMSSDNSSSRDWGRNSLVDVCMGLPGTYAQEPDRQSVATWRGVGDVWIPIKSLKIFFAPFEDNNIFSLR